MLGEPMNSSKSKPTFSLNTIEIFAYISELIFAILVWLFYDATVASLGIGFAIFCLGFALKLWSAGYKDRLTEQDQFMGPYRFLRFPHETASMLIAIGIAIAARSPLLMFLVLIVGGIGVAFEGRSVDRRRVRSDFAYLRYKVFVSSFLPSITPYGEPVTGIRFNWRRIFSAEPFPGKLDFLIFAILFFIWGLVFTHVPHLQSVSPYIAMIVALFFAIRLWTLKRQLKSLMMG